MENQRQNELEIDFAELYYYVKKRLWIIAAVTLVCAVLGYGYTNLFMDTEYTANTRIYVLNRSNENFVSYSDFQISTVMLKDSVVLIKGQNVTEKVVEKLGLNMSAARLEGMIDVTAPNDTRVLQISVTDTDPQRAADIANCVREIASVQIKDIMDVDAVNLVYEAEVPRSRSGPNVNRNTALAAAVGMLLSLGVLVLIHLIDDTIRTEDDVERYLNLSVMGVIPQSAEMSNMGKPAGTAATAKSGKKRSEGKPKAKK